MSRILTTLFAPAERLPLEEVRQQGEEFAQTTLLAEMLDSVPAMIVIVNQQRQVIFANRALLKFTGDRIAPEGQRPGEILDCAHAFETLAGCGTTEFCRTCGAVQAILSSLNGEITVNECRIIQRSGDALDLRVSASPFVHGELHLSIFAIEDISHEKRLQALEHIFYHDIMNVAGTIMGYAELMGNPEYDSDTEMMREIIYRASVRLVDEIRNQRALLAAENGDLKAEPIWLNTLEVLGNVKAFFDGHQAAEDRLIVIAPGMQALHFECDQVLLERVLGNLVKNALEACQPGEAVTLSCGGDGSHVWFEVHNPVFMPRDIQLQLFQRSFSTKGRGRGLGTYSVKLLTERYLHGTITFASSPDQGTCFRATYPVG